MGTTIYCTGIRRVLTVLYQNHTVSSQRPQRHGYGTLDGRYTGIMGCMENGIHRKIKIVYNIKKKGISSINFTEHHVDCDTSVQQCPGWLGKLGKGVVFQLQLTLFVELTTCCEGWVGE